MEAVKRAALGYIRAKRLPCMSWLVVLRQHRHSGAVIRIKAGSTQSEACVATPYFLMLRTQRISPD